MKTLYMKEREEECFARLERLMAAMRITAPVIFDVGANVGQSIEKFRQVWPSSQIHSFEPNPSSFSNLQSRWKNEKGITLQNLAMSDKRGKVPFHATRVSEVASLLRPNERLRRISTEHKYDFEVLEIQAETLDHYCAGIKVPEIDLLKIDVQGAELSVLQGAKSLLDEEKVKFIYLETTFAECYEGQTNFGELVTFLHASAGGYHLWDIVPFLYTGCDRLWATNSIFASNAIRATLEK